MIEGIQAVAGDVLTTQASASIQPQQPSFSSYLAGVNDSLQQAEQSVQAYYAGEDMSLHQVMIDLSSAQSKLELLAEVRDRFTDGLDKVLRMQI